MSQQIGQDSDYNEHVCKNCGRAEVEEGYALDLCRQCRDNLSKRPLPMKIKLIGVLLSFVIVFCFVYKSHYLVAGIHYQKGVNAERKHKLNTALKEFKYAEKYFPDSNAVLAKLYVESYNNRKISDAYNIFKKLEGREFKDKNQLDEVNNVTKKMEKYYYTSNKLNSLLKKYESADNKTLISQLKTYIKSNNSDILAKYYLADCYFSEKDFESSENILADVVADNQDFYDAQLLFAADYRESNDCDEAVKYCQDILDDNSENVPAIIALSKIELKRHNNTKGLNLAKKAYDLDNSTPSVIANLSLAYHYNNMKSQRDKLYNTLKQVDKNDTYDINFLASIYNGSIKWQN